MTNKIIAICGSKRSGKDVLADHLVKKYNYEKMKISQPLKDLLSQLFNFSHDQLETDLKELKDPNWDITPRQAMQFFGTEIMQYKIQELLPAIGKKFWINSLISKLSIHKKYVISDLRFLHEYEEFIKYNVYIIKIVRPNLKVDDDNHISEEEFNHIPCDLVLQNDSDIESLLNKFDNAFNLIKFDDSLTRK